MRGTISLRFDRMVPHGKLDECIAVLEDGLWSIKRTPYHRILRKVFLAQTKEMAARLAGFWQRAADANVKLAAIYSEMNGFTINPGEWHCHLFGYKKAGDIWELERLSDWDAASDERFILRGMESVQKALAEHFLDESLSPSVGLAQEVAEHLVTARFMQLLAAAHKAAKRHCAALKGLPVLATAHDWDTLHQTA